MANTNPLFMHYDQVILDAEYNNLAKVPDSQNYLQRWVEQSQITRQTLPAYLNIAYGSQPEETLDIFPADVPHAPIQVFFHGGYWKALHKDDFSFVANGLQPAGITTIVVNYGLIPSIRMATLIQQCRAALVWIWRNAAKYGADPQRISIFGHSAGGHIVAMLLASQWSQIAADVPDNLIKTACGVSGLYDLLPIQHSFLNQDLQLSAAEVAECSPVNLSQANHLANDKPLLLAVGSLEGAEYLRQSQALANLWSANLQVLSGHDHFSIMAQLEHPDSELSQQLRDLC